MRDLNKDLSWVKNGDPVSGIHSIYETTNDTELAEGYDYGINLPYFELSKNDKVIAGNLKEVINDFNIEPLNQDKMRGSVFLSFQVMPNTEKWVDEPNALFDWRYVATTGNKNFGISLDEFTFLLENNKLPGGGGSGNCPGLSYGERSYPINPDNLFGIGTKVIVTVRFTPRAFGRWLHIEGQGRLTVSMPDDKSYDAPFSVKSNGFDYGNWMRSWNPYQGGCAGSNYVSFVYTTKSSSDRMTLSLNASGTTASAMSVSLIDVDIRPVVPRFK